MLSGLNTRLIGLRLLTCLIQVRSPRRSPLYLTRWNITTWWCACGKSSTRNTSQIIWDTWIWTYLTTADVMKLEVPSPTRTGATLFSAWRELLKKLQRKGRESSGDASGKVKRKCHVRHSSRLKQQWMSQKTLFGVKSLLIKQKKMKILTRRMMVQSCSTCTDRRWLKEV